MADTPLAGKTLLVVEDEAFVASDLAALLSDAGAEVKIANVADEAMNHLRDTRFDAAILDVHLANGSTYTLADELRAHKTPFVFLSGYLTVREGYTDIPFLEKPFTAETVTTALTDLLAKPAPVN